MGGAGGPNHPSFLGLICYSKYMYSSGMKKRGQSSSNFIETSVKKSKHSESSTF